MRMLPYNPINRRRGFALFEFVVYCALVTVILTALTTAATHNFMEKNRLIQLDKIERTARIVSGTIAREIQSASSLHSPLNNATSGILALNTATGTSQTSFFL